MPWAACTGRLNLVCWSPGRVSTRTAAPPTRVSACTWACRPTRAPAFAWGMPPAGRGARPRPSFSTIPSSTRFFVLFLRCCCDVVVCVACVARLSPFLSPRHVTHTHSTPCHTPSLHTRYPPTHHCRPYTPLSTSGVAQRHAGPDYFDLGPVAPGAE
jgi:hypothetical protein